MTVQLGGPAPLVNLYIVIDPAHFHGRTCGPFIPAVVPPYWSLFRSPEDAVRGWSYGRTSASDRLAHALILTYRFTAHGVGCAVLGVPILSVAYWGGGGFYGVRLRSCSLEASFECGGMPVLVLECIQNVAEVFENPRDYLAV